MKSHTSCYQKGAEEEGRRAHLENARARKSPSKSDYERQLLKVVKAQPTKKKAGKGVLQLRDTSRPLSLLIVADQYGSNVDVIQRKYGEPTLFEIDSLENYFIESGLSYSMIENIVVGLEFPRADVVDEWRRNFAPGRSLMNPKHLHVLSTQIFAINNWCMEASKDGVDWIFVRIRNHHYFRSNPKTTILLDLLILTSFSRSQTLR